MELMRPVFLIGYMCSGKTTLGLALAQRLGCEFIDLDNVVEQTAGCSISHIFEQYGPAAFRRMESDALRTVATRCAVISLGGGTPCFGDNMDIALAAGIVVKLDAPIDCLVRRLVEGAAKRPLMAGKTPDAIRTRALADLAARNPYYDRAHHTFDSSRLETQQQIDESVDRFIATIIKH